MKRSSFTFHWFYAVVLRAASARFKTLLLLTAFVCVFSHAFSQCGSGDDITLDFPEGTCSTSVPMLIYDDSYPESFILYEKVNGIYWQQRDVIMNDAPPIWYYLQISQTTLFGITHVLGGCESTMKEFTVSPAPQMPSASGNTQLCSGQSTTLTASSSETSYRWYIGSTLISGITGSQYNTGPLTASKNYYVSAVTPNGCESDKRPIAVTVYNPTAPTPYAQTRCGPGDVTLTTNNSGFAGYEWYDQNNSLLGTTGSNYFTVSSTGLSSYKVKIEDTHGCWSGMSSSAAVTTTHNEPPYAYSGTACGPNTQVPMRADYFGERAGNYYVEWYTTQTGGTPEYSASVGQYEDNASYSPNLPADKAYWVDVYDPATSSECRTERTYVLAQVGSTTYVSGHGYSCEYNTAYIQCQSSSNISTYYLYKYEDVGSGLTYNLIQSNGTGSFTIDEFYSNDTQYASNYYIRGVSTSGCWSSYSNVDIEVMRPAMPTVSGNTNPCYNTSTTLRASGGYEGDYRWYQGTNLISGATGSQYSTGPLTSSTTYYVSYIVDGSYGQCESPKREVTVTVRNPVAPAPNAVTRCGPGDVVLSTNNSGFSEYSWYDQNGSLAGSTSSNSLIASAAGLTSYTVKVRDSYNCWSGMSSSAAVTTTHNEAPYASLGTACGPNTHVPINVDYFGQRAGNYYVEWYTTATGGTPEYSASVGQFEDNASYSPYLPADKSYWVDVYDPATSSECRTERTYVLAAVGSAPSVWGQGHSCEYNTAYIQCQSSSNISTYYLYRYEDLGSGLTYNLVQSNSTGSFTVNDFYSDDTQYTSNYYVRGISTAGCWSSYSNIDIEVMRPAMPAVTGNTNVCLDQSTSLTATGGFEGTYRWYEGTDTNLLPGETSALYNTGPLTSDAAYYVSYIMEGGSGAQCESSKRQVNIDVKPVPEKPLVISPMVKRCGAGTVTLEANGYYAAFQWYDDNGNAVPGATSASFLFSANQLDEATTYKVTGISAFGCESDFTEIVGTAVSKCENYVHEELVKESGVTTEDELIGLTVDGKTDAWNYYDGLGRPMQTVMEQFSPLGNDLVQPIAYDVLGRQTFTYLPYTPTSDDDGRYRPDAVADQADFYESLDHVDPDSDPWAEKEFEPSPLNRVTKQGAPGESWQLGTNHAAQFEYLINDGSENIFNWRYDHSTETIVKGADYGANQLFVNVTVDEQGHATREYKDKQGRIVLKKVQEAETPGTGHTGWLCTYYVYDDFGDLKAVIPPQAVAEMDNALDYTLVNDAVFSKNWLFKYKYDGRHRMIEKEIPGAESVLMVYDRWDRLVLTRNGEQKKAEQWLCTKYDHLNRPILTGLVVLQDVDADDVRANVRNSAIRSEQRIATGVGYSLDNTYPALAESDLLTVTYYDNYNFPFAAETGFDYFPEIGISSYRKSNVMGLVTGEMTRVLDDDRQWLKKITYYDDYRRVSQTISTNHLGDGGLDRASTTYDFTGKIQQTLLTHTGNTPETVSQTFDYDNAGRLKQVIHQVNNQDPVAISAREYNETGSLIRNKLHEWTEPGMAGTFAQSVDYHYNVRGWLTGINDPLLTDVQDLFGMRLQYETGTDAQFNGNISGIQWKNSMQKSANQYGFAYDAANRLTAATYSARSSSGTWNVNSGFYNATIDEYDKNGNIMMLSRYANNSASGEIDHLEYEYGQGTSLYSNQLIGVNDNSTSVDKDLGFKDVPGDDYAYDDNGNLRKDGNKGVTDITYNYLNLPQTVAFGSSNRIEYTYDAAGLKLRQQVYENDALSKTTDYLGPMVFENNTLYQIATSEGRLVPAPAGNELTYQYHLTDHLGNVRLTFQEGQDEFFLATMESDDPGTASLEEGQFSNVAETRQPFGSANQTPGGNEVAQVDGLHPVGPAISLDVLPGDVVNIEAYAYYEGTSGNTHVQTLDAMIGLVAGAYGGVNGGSESAQAIYDGVDNALAIVGLGGTDNDAIPAAYVSYILFDRNMTYLNAGWLQVTSAGHMQKERIAFEPITITEPGIIYVYVSNESDEGSPVYFDDLKVTHDKKLEVVQADDYYPFGMSISGLQYRREDLKRNDYLYNGKEEQNELRLNLYDYGFRMYDPAIGRWGSSDPLAEFGFSLTPFRYCFNNPVNYTDPLGLWERDANGNYSTDDKEDIERLLSYLTIESMVLNNNPSIEQINGFIDGEESESGLGKLSDGSQLVSTVAVNGYQHGNRVKWYTDKKSFDNSWHDVQGSLTPHALDPRTIGNNIFGLSYPGGNNPRKYNGNYDYSYAPIRLSEYPAIGHDRRYDNMGAAGASGLFFDSRTIGADWKFVSEEFSIASTPLDLKTRAQALGLGIGLAVPATLKSIAKFASPQPATSGAAGAEVMMWYSISNIGVTNKPH